MIKTGAKIFTFFQRAYTWFSEDITVIPFLSNNSYSMHASLYLRSLAIFAWGLSRLRLEKADEVLRIFKAEVLAYLRYAEGFIIKQLTGKRKQTIVDHTLGGFAGLSLDQFSEIFGRIAAFVGKVGYGRQPLTLRFTGNVFIEQRDELLYHRMINLLACDELTVVEAQTVVQQQLDVGNDEFTRMLIYRMLQFLLNHCEYITEDIDLGSG